MYFRLAKMLGRTVAELERTLPHSEFIEWAAFYEYEPWGCEPEDYRWRQFFQLFWAANFKGDAPEFLQRYPRHEPQIDPFMAYLDRQIVAQSGDEDDPAI